MNKRKSLPCCHPHDGKRVIQAVSTPSPLSLAMNIIYEGQVLAKSEIRNQKTSFIIIVSNVTTTEMQGDCGLWQ